MKQKKKKEKKRKEKRSCIGEEKGRGSKFDPGCRKSSKYDKEKIALTHNLTRSKRLNQECSLQYQERIDRGSLFHYERDSRLAFGKTDRIVSGHCHPTIGETGVIEAES